MKILYAIQGTGNGHLSRSMEIAPYLMQHAQVDFLISGPLSCMSGYTFNVQDAIVKTKNDICYNIPLSSCYENLALSASQDAQPQEVNSILEFDGLPTENSVQILKKLNVPYPIRFIKHGISYISSSRGGVDFWKTCKYFKPLKLWHDITTLPVERYDLVISDCEPISAWASSRKKVPCMQISNQAAFFSPHMPRPERINRYIEAAMRYYIPHTSKIAFHYNQYDTFIQTPIIRKEIRLAQVSDEGHITVYLPAYSPQFLAHYFMRLKNYVWHIFSPEIKHAYQVANIKFFPITNNYSSTMLSSHVVICAAGFQATAECLHLGKKMLVIPQYHQYEQLCNAAALKQLGCTIVSAIDNNFIDQVQHWLVNDNPVQVIFPDNAQTIAQTILSAL